ncbi:MAG TPA: hypothetical protein VM555_12775 [Tahibacter sp.]|nr:hypothetical protein [Tahibacter sp.]
MAPLALGACSWFKPKSDWDKAVEARPLEVPPDLETPPRTNDMVVPEAGGAAATADAPRRAARAATGIDGLHVADSVGNAWQRIGLALERANIGQVASKDEAGHTYELTLTSTREKAEQGGWIKRLFTRKKMETVTERVNIGVSADGEGSRVSVSGDAAAVRRVVALLRERLG